MRLQSTLRISSASRSSSGSDSLSRSRGERMPGSILAGDIVGAASGVDGSMLSLAIEQREGEQLEWPSGGTQRKERLSSLIDKLASLRLAPLDAKYDRIGQLASAGIFSDPLTYLCRVPLRVEQVVGN